MTGQRGENRKRTARPRRIPVTVPRSSVPGIGWPAVPNNRNAAVLALQFQMAQSQWWPAAAVRAAQFRQLEPLLRHAAATVPHYRQRLAGVAGIKPGGLDDETWRAIPLLTRQDIQEAGDALVSRRLPKAHGQTVDIRTSGSTGRPIAIKGSGITGLFFTALNLRYHLWHRRNFAATVACIRNLGPRQAAASEAGKGSNWAPAHRSGPMYYFPINRPVSEQAAWLAEIDPHYLLTFPSNLAALLKHSRDNGWRPARMTQVTTMSEVLDAPVRALCAEVWGLPVVDSYSSEEAGVIALQCPDHPDPGRPVYHVQSESLLVEILDGDGTPCPPGAVGRVVLTALHNFATPLIRYEIGDYAEAGGPCPCGRGLAALNRIVGRSRNMLVLPSGDELWPSLPEDRIMPLAPIRQFQVVQKSLEEIEVRLAVARPLRDDEERRLKEVLSDCLHHPFRLDFHYMDEIPRSPGGKYEDFISLVRHDQASNT